MKILNVASEIFGLLRFKAENLLLEKTLSSKKLVDIQRRVAIIHWTKLHQKGMRIIKPEHQLDNSPPLVRSYRELLTNEFGIERIFLKDVFDSKEFNLFLKGIEQNSITEALEHNSPVEAIVVNDKSKFILFSTFPSFEVYSVGTLKVFPYRKYEASLVKFIAEQTVAGVLFKIPEIDWPIMEPYLVLETTAANNPSWTVFG
jgi:hypothetical protein